MGKVNFKRLILWVAGGGVFALILNFILSKITGIPIIFWPLLVAGPIIGGMLSFVRFRSNFFQKNTITVFLIASIVLFWIDLFIILHTWLNFYDRVFRIAVILLLPILLLVAVLSILFIRDMLKESKDNKKQSSSKTIFLVAILILVLGIHTVAAYSSLNTGGQTIVVTNIDSKEKDNGYYLYVKDVDTNNLIKLRCDDKVYSDIIIDDNVSYSFVYRTSFFDSKSGVLSDLDLEDYVDNRITSLE